LKTGDDQKFVSEDGGKRSSRKLLRGENVSRYSIDWAGEFVDYRPDAMKKHRRTARPGEADRFEGEKGLVRDTSSVLEGALDSAGFLGKEVLIVGDRTGAIEPAYVAALVNSSLLRWFYQRSFPTIHVQAQELRSLPLAVPENNDDLVSELAELARRCQKM